MEKLELRDIVEQTITGEWGTEINNNENDIYVIRTADFNNNGTINYEKVLKRNIDSNKIQQKKLKIGDIIIEKSGGTDNNPVGRVVYFNREDYICIANNFTQVIRIKENVNPKYVFYNLFYQYKLGSTLKMFNKTTGIQNLQMKQYLSQKINMVNFNNQNRIVEELDKIQEIIDIRKKQIEELENLVKSQFVKMFGNPVLNDFNWRKEICKKLTNKIGSGATPDGGNQNYKETGISLIRSMNVYDGYFEYKDLAHIDEEQASKLKNVEIKENDILFNITGASVARTCIVPSEIIPARVNQHVSIIRCNEKINNIYLNYLLINDSFKKNLLNIAKAGGGTREAITKAQIENLEIIIPPTDLQKKFADFVKLIDKQKFELQKSLEEIKKLQESLMNKYFN